MQFSRQRRRQWHSGSGGRCQMTLPFLWIKPPNLYSGRGGRNCSLGGHSHVTSAKFLGFEPPPPCLCHTYVHFRVPRQYSVRKSCMQRRLPSGRCGDSLYSIARESFGPLSLSLFVTSGGAAVKGGAVIGRESAHSIKAHFRWIHSLPIRLY